MKEDQNRLEIGMLLYPGLTLLDLIGPQTVFSWFANIHLVWKTTEPIRSDTGIELRPNASFETCPRDLDVLFVPGGFGQGKLMTDAEVLSFLADRGSRAKYVTSVCSGSLLLGAAGLLNGYRATSHWAAREGLAAFGAIATDARVVEDRNRVTGGGVTAGLDFGLVLLAKLCGEDAAKATQLAMEYDPQPPFQSGNPKEAGPTIVQKAMSFMVVEMERMAGLSAAQ
jgi:cyclohexyl-isocyanide hydratase